MFTCGAACQAARRLPTGAPGGLPTRRRLPACPTIGRKGAVFTLVHSLKLAIFGGTFDPIHDGHLALARGAAVRFRLDRVLFVPAAHPPHKAGVTHAPYAD